MMIPPVNTVRTSPASPARVEPQPVPQPPGPERAVVPTMSKAAIAFESVVLRTFVEAMLPRDGFGEGTAGHMWRGQMADALADTLARSGGIGLAATLEDTA